MSEANVRFAPKWVSPPGDTIDDILEELGWSQSEFAERTGYTTKHVNQLIHGKAPISEDTAFRLERVLGSSADFWLSRESKYREALAREDELEALRDQVGWLKELPLAHMIKYGWVSQFSDKRCQVAECLSFFGVASVNAWRSKYAESLSLAAFKTSQTTEKKVASVAAWLRRGERRATSLDCQEFDKTAFLRKLRGLRALTNEVDPNVFVPKLVEECASVGVAIVIEPAPTGCPATGATKWLTPKKALLMLSLRYKSNDHLWFALFHEAAHILLHGKKMLFLEMNGGMDSEAEQEADQFASNFLIPPDAARSLPYLGRTAAAVSDFASEIGIAPGIVVGRLQHERLLPRSYLNKLKVFYRWT